MFVGVPSVDLIIRLFSAGNGQKIEGKK